MLEFGIVGIASEMDILNSSEVSNEIKEHKGGFGREGLGIWRETLEKV